MPGVHGHQESGLRICSLPTLDVAFHFYAAGDLRRMIAETVRRRLADLTPQALSRFLPPPQARLQEVSVRVADPKPSRNPYAELPTLMQTAQAIGEPSYRRRFSASWQREGELAQLIHKLGGERANVAVVGEHGAGKSTLLVNAVRALERSVDDTDKTAPIVRRRYWLTTAGRLIAGMRYLGEWQIRCETVIGELSAIDGVLCVENLLDLVLLGGTAPAGSIAAFMIPFLQNGQLRLVAETTPEEFDACRRLLPGLANVFQVLRLDPMHPRQARAALAAVADQRAGETKVACDGQTPDTVDYLFRRFMPYHAMPGKAARFLSSLFEKAKQDGRQGIGIPQVIESFIELSGLPEAMLRDDRPLAVADVEEWFHERIIGQNEACRIAAEIIATFKAGLNDPRRPLGTLLFCGPTGVGKTELAKAMSRYLFGHGRHADRLIRLDMSEYASPWSAERLLAKDDGRPSDFVEKVRQQPFVVVLLDEIEKAAAPVFDMLLGMLDEGRLTDRNGRTTIFRSAIVILTSNLGAATRSSIGFDAAAPQGYAKAVQDFFRPEFFNRIDAVVSFSPLDVAVCRSIVRKEIGEIALREGLKRAGLRLRASDALVDRLLASGFDPRYGARPLQRTLETRIVTPLSRFLLEIPGLHDVEIELDATTEGTLIIR